MRIIDRPVESLGECDGGQSVAAATDENADLIESPVMTAKFLAGGLLALLLMSTSSSSSQTQAHHTKTGVYHTGKASKDDMYVVPDLAERLAKWKPVEMPFHSEGSDGARAPGS